MRSLIASMGSAWIPQGAYALPEIYEFESVIHVNIHENHSAPYYWVWHWSDMDWHWVPLSLVGGDLDTSTLDTYTATYSATDPGNGLETTVTQTVHVTWTNDIPSAEVATGDYALLAHDGRPVTVQDDGSLLAGGSGTRFGVHPRAGGEYAIQGNSTWLNADADGLSSSAPNGDYAEQHFYLVDAGDGKVHIMTSAGGWLLTDYNISFPNGGLLIKNGSQEYQDYQDYRSFFRLIPAPGE